MRARGAGGWREARTVLQQARHHVHLVVASADGGERHETARARARRVLAARVNLRLVSTNDAAVRTARVEALHRQSRRRAAQQARRRHEQGSVEGGYEEERHWGSAEPEQEDRRVAKWVSKRNLPQIVLSVDRLLQSVSPIGYFSQSVLSCSRSATLVRSRPRRFVLYPQPHQVPGSGAGPDRTRQQ